LQLQFWNTHII